MIDLEMEILRLNAKEMTFQGKKFYLDVVEINLTLSESVINNDNKDQRLTCITS